MYIVRYNVKELHDKSKCHLNLLNHLLDIYHHGVRFHPKIRQQRKRRSSFHHMSACRRAAT